MRAECTSKRRSRLRAWWLALFAVLALGVGAGGAVPVRAEAALRAGAHGAHACCTPAKTRHHADCARICALAAGMIVAQGEGVSAAAGETVRLYPAAVTRLHGVTPTQGAPPPR